MVVYCPFVGTKREEKRGGGGERDRDGRDTVLCELKGVFGFLLTTTDGKDGKEMRRMGRM